MFLRKNGPLLPPPFSKNENGGGKTVFPSLFSQKIYTPHGEIFFYLRFCASASLREIFLHDTNGTPQGGVPYKNLRVLCVLRGEVSCICTSAPLHLCVRFI
jgi:hypothetical protein